MAKGKTSIFESAKTSWQGPVTGLWWDAYDHLDDLVREYNLCLRVEPCPGAEDPANRTVDIYVKGQQFNSGLKFLKSKLDPEEEEKETQEKVAS